MLARGEETNLVLNWEKCHFMVKEGIVLGHKISKSGIEVDNAKIDVIAKLLYPTNVKGVRSFLGHAGFYRSNQDAKPMLTRWVLLLQEFTIEIKDKKDIENLAADHLSRLENLEQEKLNEEAIRDSFPNEHLMAVHEILEHCHMRPVGGHYGANITTRKIFELGFYWPTIFKDVARFEAPKALITDRGTHFCNSLLEKTLKKYGVTHRLATPYHPQTSSQTKNTNRAIKRILERTMNVNRKEWADKLDDALLAFRTAYKSPIVSTPFKIMYEKACHLPVEMEHKAYWALKNVNLDLDTAGKHRTKRWHDAKIMDEEFHEREEVIVFNSRLKLFPRKLKTRWYGPYTINKVFPYGTVEVLTARNGNLMSPRLVVMCFSLSTLWSAGVHIICSDHTSVIPTGHFGSCCFIMFPPDCWSMVPAKVVHGSYWYPAGRLCGFPSSYSAFDHDYDILVESRSWILQLVSEPHGSRSRILQDGSYWSRTITTGTGLDSYWFYNVPPGHHGYCWSYHVPPGSMTLVSPGSVMIPSGVVTAFLVTHVDCLFGLPCPLLLLVLSNMGRLTPLDLG
ncbi:reverse transcriptase domain-containing protein [Tanacetum coccineum]